MTRVSDTTADEFLPPDLAALAERYGVTLRYEPEYFAIFARCPGDAEDEWERIARGLSYQSAFEEARDELEARAEGGLNG